MQAIACYLHIAGNYLIAKRIIYSYKDFVTIKVLDHFTILAQIGKNCFHNLTILSETKTNCTVNSNENVNIDHDHCNYT